MLSYTGSINYNFHFFNYSKHLIVQKLTETKICYILIVIIRITMISIFQKFQYQNVYEKSEHQKV